jgi:hypothetical protein
MTFRFCATIVLSMLTMLAATMSHAQIMMSRSTESTKHTVSDAEKLADALRAGPDFVTAGATVLDWPSTPGGEYRVLRKGASQWTCLPGVPGYSHDEPGCFDPAFMTWIKESLAGKEPQIRTVGIAYMYVGAWVTNKSDAMSKEDEFHVGPHVMIVSPHENQKELEGFSHDGSNGQPYVAHLPKGHDLYLVMPYREWPQK